MKQVPHWGSTNIRGHHKKNLKYHGDLVPRICAPLALTLVYSVGEDSCLVGCCRVSAGK